MRARMYAAGAAALLMLAGPWGCGSPPERLTPPGVGDPVPAYGARTLAGDSLGLADLRGTPVMLNVWATWCAPCREEMPGLQQLHERYSGRGLRIVAVSVDTRGAESAIVQFVESLGLTFTILHDPADRVTQQFRTTGVPQTFLIDRDGLLTSRWIGRFDPVSPSVIALVEDALAEGQADQRTGERTGR